MRHIEVFSAVMLTGSTNGAARILNISQPAVSKILQHAEQSVGFPLFLRSKGKLVPTQEALQLQRELRPFDEQLRRIRRLAAALSHGSARPLRIAATPALAHHLLPQAVVRWSRTFPQSNCELSVAHTREIEEALLLNEIEIGLTMRPVSHPNLALTLLRSCDLCAIAPAGWWAEKLLKRPLCAQELTDQPVITIDADDHLGGIISSWLEDAGSIPKSAISVQTYTLAKSLVQARVGVALVDWFTANYPPAASDIQVRAMDIASNLNVYALTQHERPPPRAAERLMKFLRVC
ncbi:LysR substrate-binding domain-containing protein [Bradyrhizobium sp. RT11b]|uniref:LysR family transcriptional regulator n=1 Tax=Bradyrhizobium sp. RT11b TaxID=3156332 RepID=UPI00339A31AD